jgi:hypothetical protein
MKTAVVLFALDAPQLLSNAMSVTDEGDTFWLMALGILTVGVMWKFKGR